MTNGQRDYKKELNWEKKKKPGRVKDRASRNAARKLAGLKKGDPRQVDHKDNNPRNNSDLDLNSNDINNVKDITMTGDFTVDGVDYLASMQTLYDNYLALIDRVTISTASPSGGSDGDIWFKVT